MMLPISVVAPFIAAIVAGCAAGGGGGGVTAFSTTTAASRRTQNLAPMPTATSFSFTAQNNNYHDIVLRTSRRVVESWSTSCHSSRQFMRWQKSSSLSTALFIANTSEDEDDNISDIKIGR